MKITKKSTWRICKEHYYLWRNQRALKMIAKQCDRFNRRMRYDGMPRALLLYARCCWLDLWHMHRMPVMSFSYFLIQLKREESQ